VNEGGVFGVWLCISGEWKLIVLDGYFPCRGPNEGPLFSKANGDELWVLLLEKAYAKCYGNYMNIEAGITGRALRDLTGAPYEFIMAE
jgi:calpain-15